MGRDVNELFIDAVKFALGTGQLKKLQNLLSTGANVNTTTSDEKRWTALHMAAHKGMKNVTDLLLASGPLELDARDGQQYTPLHFAAIQGHLKTVQALVEAGAAVDVKNAEGKLPRALAEAQGHSAVASYFDQVEADLAELAALADEGDEDGEEL